MRTYRSSDEGPGPDSERTTEAHGRIAPPTAGGGRLSALWGTLDPNQRLAAAAALALAVSVFLPWWRDPILEVTYIGFRRLTFIELGLFLIAAAVLVLLVRRAEGRVFHLPLSDATLIATAGFWSLVLLTVRVLDPPTRTGTRVSDRVEVTRDYSVRWGILIAFAAAGLLALAGVQERRRRHHGQPEAVAADEDATPVHPEALGPQS